MNSRSPGLNGGDAVTWGTPTVGIPNYAGIGDSTDGPFVNNNNSLQFLNNASITRGKHAFRFGAEVRRDQYNQDGNQFGRGSFSFSTTPTWDPSTSSGGDAFASFLGNVTLTEVAAQIASVQYRQTSFYRYATTSGRLRRTSRCPWARCTRTLRRGPTNSANWWVCSSMPTTPHRT